MVRLYTLSIGLTESVHWISVPNFQNLSSKNIYIKLKSCCFFEKTNHINAFENASDNL